MVAELFVNLKPKTLLEIELPRILKNTVKKT